MSIIDRRFTYRGRLKVSREDLRLASSGRKTCTIRVGKLGVGDDIVDLIDGHEKLKIKVTKVDSTRFYGSLTDEDARMDGLESKQDLDRDLQRFYGVIDPGQPMTIIYFEVVEK